MHTAVKIAPEYEHGVVHVLDASRSVTVAGSLLSKEQKPAFLSNVQNEYIRLKEDFGKKQSIKQYISFADAQKNALKIDWNNYIPPTPSFTGTKVFCNYDLDEIRKYIDWSPFFIAWEMGGRFPQLLEDEVIGKEATKLYNDANLLLDEIIAERWLTADGVIGCWQANKISYDSVKLKAGTIGEETVCLEFLRQQVKKAPGQPNLSLADFIKSVNTSNSPGLRKEQDLRESTLDYIGAFAVTIKGIEPYIIQFEQQHDDYKKIILQALADRLVEAFAELLHQRVRKELWGYEKEEQLTIQDLIKEKYQGIRPAPGYPACPDHTEKYKLFKLLKVTENTGIQLTESLAMYPAASICGWYFSHPQSQYFGVGKISEDQLKDYTLRKGWSIDEAKRWLGPNLE
jgi:5-methyltetrahydrofolate--homocysteine methyltransferase